MDITVVGLGHLGLPLAALLAEAGHRVRGVDNNAAHVRSLQNGVVGWHEPGLDALLARASARLRFDTDAALAAAASAASIIAVPTPADPTGAYDSAYVLKAAESLGVGLKAVDHAHTVIVLSTLMPGTLVGEVAPRLARAAGRPVSFCYCPAFGAIGDLLRGYQRPDFLLLGESDDAAGDCAQSLFASIHVTDVPVLRRTPLNAELAKIALNNFMIAKISFAAMIGMLCAEIPGADSERVLSVLGYDKRIGPLFLRAAMPYGGPCFARDAAALVALGARHGQAAPIAEAAEAINVAHDAAILTAIRRATPPGGAVAILGLAFRYATDVTEESRSLDIALRLAREGYPVRCWDPLARPALEGGAVLSESLSDAVAGAATILIGNDDPLCAALPRMKRPDGTPVVVFDYWRRLSSVDAAAFDVRRF